MGLTKFPRAGPGQIKITRPGRAGPKKNYPGRAGQKKNCSGRAGQLFLAARPDGPGRPAANYGSGSSKNILQTESNLQFCSQNLREREQKLRKLDEKKSNYICW